jgi:hypothetical protein
LLKINKEWKRYVIYKLGEGEGLMFGDMLV